MWWLESPVQQTRSERSFLFSLGVTPAEGSMMEPSQQYPFRLAPLQLSRLCVGLIYDRLSVDCKIAAESGALITKWTLPGYAKTPCRAETMRKEETSIVDRL